MAEDRPNLLTTAQAARVLQASARSLARWRQVGVGPDYIRIERLVRYRRSDLEAYTDRQTVTQQRAR